MSRHGITTNVVVTGAGGAAGVAVVRALRSTAGVRVLAADSDPHAPGVELAHHGFVLPRADSAKFIPMLLQACRHFAVDAIVCTVAEEMLAIESAQSDIHATGTKVWLPPASTVALCNDKSRFATVLRQHGIATPATSTTLRDLVAGPWIVKPRQARGSRNVIAADSIDDVAYALRRVDDPIIQTRVQGREFTVDVLVERDGTVVGLSPRWRLATKGGISTSGVTFQHPAVTHLVERTMKALQYRGVACLQGFLSDEGEATCIEVNPRFGGGVSLSIAAGADFTGEFVRATLGGRARNERLRADVGVRMTRFFNEIISYNEATADKCA